MMRKQSVAKLAFLILTGLLLAVAGTVVIWSGPLRGINSGEQLVNDKNISPADGQHALAKATFGGGCFWCTEAVYQQFTGVHTVESGYAGGAIPNPSYRDVCRGITGHAEVVQITYDPQIVSYAQLLEAFWQSHDPTTLNRQGNDIGTQYRSIILYHDQEQKRLAETAVKRLEEASVFRSPIVTEIAPLEAFFPAEDLHQNFYRSNKNPRYCNALIRPKVEKIRQIFADQVHPTGP